MNQIPKQLFLFLTGGITYIIIELFFRGYSHWTMFILGGICFVCIGLINEVLPWNMPLWLQALIGAILITTLELITGCIVNLWLGWNIWNYSALDFNFMGQICLQFSILWYFIALAAIILDDYIRYWKYGEEKPRYVLF